MPACDRAPGFSAQDFHDFIFMSRVQCQECGASIIIRSLRGPFDFAQGRL